VVAILGNVGFARKHVTVGAVEVARKKGPAALDFFVALVCADVAAPDDDGTDFREIRDQPGRLGVV